MAGISHKIRLSKTIGRIRYATVVSVDVSLAAVPLFRRTGAALNLIQQTLD
jgi:hypothetical protein